jgi:hypothetical protein
MAYRRRFRCCRRGRGRGRLDCAEVEYREEILKGIEMELVLKSQTKSVVGTL